MIESPVVRHGEIACRFVPITNCCKSHHATLAHAVVDLKHVPRRGTT